MQQLDDPVSINTLAFSLLFFTLLTAFNVRLLTKAEVPAKLVRFRVDDFDFPDNSDFC